MQQKSAKESLNYFKVISLSSATSPLPINKVIKTHLVRQVETWAAEFESENQAVRPAYEKVFFKPHGLTRDETVLPMDVVTDID